MATEGETAAGASRGSDALGTTSSGDDESTEQTGTPPIWSPRGCNVSPGDVQVRRAITPNGEFVAVDGRFGYDWCGHLWFVLFDEFVETQHTPHASGLQFFLLEGPLPWIYDGTYELGLKPWWLEDQAYGKITFREPLDTWATNDAEAAVRMHARIELFEGQWDYVADLELSFCDDLLFCSCPCE